MQANLISYAVPVFFAAILVERAIDRARQRRLYRFGSAMADLNAGIASSVPDVFLKAVTLAAYVVVYRYRWVEFPEGSAWPWVFGLIGIDLLYYWWHRMSHVVNVLWAVHAVHHQSEDFNLAVALRQPALEALTVIPFHVPLALLGVPPEIYVSCYALDLIYQFWIHTELAGRVGWIEWVFNTPSLHRVHHGINPRYLDRNYGGVLAVWDRLFGTYQVEDEPPVYGVTHPLRSYNPVYANLVYFQEMGDLFRRARRPIDKLRVFVAHPGFRPEGTLEPISMLPSVSRDRVVKYDPQASDKVVRYVGVHFVILAVFGGAFASAAERGSFAAFAAPGALIVLSTVALGGLIERRPWALTVEVIRQVLALGFLAIYLASRLGPGIAALAAMGSAVVLAAIFALFRPYEGDSDRGFPAAGS
jgi:alkylglycerol monooxygenase